MFFKLGKDGAGVAAAKTTTGATTTTVAAPTSISFPVDSPAARKLVEQGISQEGWEALLAVGEVLSYREGELLMSEGDTPEVTDDREVYLLLRGECRLEVRGSPVAKLLAGEFVGEGRGLEDCCCTAVTMCLASLC